METREETCEGCDQVKTLPMICIDESDGTLFPGLCAACLENYGMQTGDLVLLKRPPEECEAEVQFLIPEIDAIRVRDRASGFTISVSWSDFEKISYPPPRLGRLGGHIAGAA